jgi:hypothetical protein
MTSQKKTFFIVTAVKASNLTFRFYLKRIGWFLWRISTQLRFSWKHSSILLWSREDNPARDEGHTASVHRYRSTINVLVCLQCTSVLKEISSSVRSAELCRRCNRGVTRNHVIHLQHYRLPVFCNGPASSSDYTSIPSNCINNEWLRNGVEVIIHCLTWGNIPAFSWRDWENLLETWANRASPPVELWCRSEGGLRGMRQVC